MSLTPARQGTSQKGNHRHVTVAMFRPLLPVPHPHPALQSLLACPTQEEQAVPRHGAKAKGEDFTVISSSHSLPVDWSVPSVTSNSKRPSLPLVPTLHSC